MAVEERNLRVALISLDQRWEDKAENMRQCEVLVNQASSLGVKMVIFPEMTLTGFSMNVSAIAESLDGSPTIGAFRSCATRHHLHIIFGAVFWQNGKGANCLLHMSPDGELLAHYTKMHPFSFSGENKVFTRGNDLAMASIGEWNFGYSICYDLRFPELFTSLAQSRCNVLVNIANWPQRRVHHWRALLQARAIESQAFMIGVNRVGTDGNGLAYEKSSCIFDSNGQELKPLQVSTCIDVYDLNYDTWVAYIKSFSTLNDRRPDLYRRLI